MASTPQMQEQTVCQESLEPSNSVVFDIERQRLDEIDVQVSRKITLTQEPNETLTLNCAVQRGFRCYECGGMIIISSEANIAIRDLYDTIDDGGNNDDLYYCNNCGSTLFKEEDSDSDYKVNVDLIFENNLHEVSQDYGYGIEIKAFIGNDDFDALLQRHLLLFTHKEMRTKNGISCTDQPFEYNVKTASNSSFVSHICINIRRFNRNDKSFIREKKDLLSFTDFYEELLETGLYSDVTIVVDDNAFPAHKHILSSKSDAFKAMFTHKTVENQDGIVKIDDFDAEVVEEMLWYVYKDKTKNPGKNAR